MERDRKGDLGDWQAVIGGERLDVETEGLTHPGGRAQDETADNDGAHHGARRTKDQSLHGRTPEALRGRAGDWMNHALAINPSLT